MASGSSGGPKCSICIDYLENPLALPCGHSYCGPPKHCLQGIKHGERGTSTKCAVCSKEFPGINVSDLNPLYGIREALPQLSARQRDNADGWPKCTNHGNKISLWCNDCALGMCVECMEAGHSTHSFRSYKERMKERALKFLDKLPQIDSKIKRLGGSINRHNVQITELEQKILELRQNIKDHQEEILKLSNEKKRLQNIMAMKQTLESVAKSQEVASNTNIHTYLREDSILNLNVDTVAFTFTEKLLTKPGCYSDDHKWNNWVLKLYFQENPIKVSLSATWGNNLHKNFPRVRLHLLNDSPEKTICEEFNEPAESTVYSLWYYLNIPPCVVSNPNLGFISNNQIRVKAEILNN